jgi:hypothetical protein
MWFVARCGLVLTWLALAAGCGSNSPGLAPLQTIDLPNLSGVAGYQDVVVAQWIPFSGGDKLQIYRQDAADPDRLLLTASVDLGGGSSFARDIGVTADWVVATSNGPRLVALSPTPSFVGSVFVGDTPTSNFPITVDRAIARGAFLFVASGATLRLYSLADPAHPMPTSSFDATGPIHAVAAVPAGFLAFGDGFLVGLSTPAQPVWTSKASAQLPFSSKAIAAGTQVVVAGQGHVAGRSQIARVDATDPTNPSVLLSADDLPVQFTDFAWDGSTLYSLFGPGTTTPGYNTSPLLLLREDHGQLRSLGTSQIWPVYGGERASMAYAWNGRLYRAEIGMKAYRLP